MSYEACLKEIPTMTYDQQLGLLSALQELLKKRPRPQSAATATQDCRSSYPDGYFELFGSIDDPTFVEPEDIPHLQTARPS